MLLLGLTCVSPPFYLQWMLVVYPSTGMYRSSLGLTFLFICLMLFHHSASMCPFSKSVSQGWRNRCEAIPAQVWKASGTSLRTLLLAGGTSDSRMERLMSGRPGLVATTRSPLPLTWGCSCNRPVASVHCRRRTSALERRQELAAHCVLSWRAAFALMAVVCVPLPPALSCYSFSTTTTKSSLTLLILFLEAAAPILVKCCFV